MGSSLTRLPGTSGRPCLTRSYRWLAAVALLASLAAGCGGGQTTARPPAAHSGSSSTAHALGTIPSATTGPIASAYCDAQDTAIPGAAAYLTGGPLPTNLTTVQQAWLEMQASMVPACSEIVPDPPAVQTQNLSSGELSDADFQTWVTEDEEWWTLVEWAGQHDQPSFITYLAGGAGDTLTSFVRAGGKVVDSQMCEYALKYDVVTVTGEQMSDLTVDRLTNPGVVYVGAAVGPCTSTWTAADGTVTNKGLAAGQEGRELDVTSTASSPALGQYLVINDIWDQGDGTAADAILGQVGI